MMTPAELVATIEAFLETTGMSATRFGREAVSDPMFVFGLRKGRDPSLTVANRVLAFIAAHGSETRPELAEAS